MLVIKNVKTIINETRNMDLKEWIMTKWFRRKWLYCYRLPTVHEKKPYLKIKTKGMFSDNRI